MTPDSTPVFIVITLSKAMDITAPSPPCSAVLPAPPLALVAQEATEVVSFTRARKLDLPMELALAVFNVMA